MLTLVFNIVGLGLLAAVILLAVAVLLAWVLPEGTWPGD